MGMLRRLLVAAVALGSVRAAIRRERAEGLEDDLLPPRALDVSHPVIVEAADFALRKLQGLSESGIFETLRLRAVHYAAIQEGVFHNNTFLTIELASPHLLDADTSLHDVLVMRDLEDGVRSVAIDEFPIMDEDAIETFWEQRVDEHRAKRDALFAELEREALAEEADHAAREHLASISVGDAVQKSLIGRQDEL